MLRLLDRTTDRDAVVLHEQPNQAATILDKFERHAQTAGYVVILLTGDDEGRVSGDSAAPTPRGHQDVILEWGVFLGLLGRTRVAVLHESGTELPSDLDGLVYVPLDAAGAWKHAVLKELASSGVAVNYSRIP